MAVDEVLRMNGGTDETSYATNSLLQKTVISKVGAVVEESIKALCSSTNPDCLTVADLGCSSGPNTLSVVQSVIHVAVSTCDASGQRVPEFNVFLNDLPQNDFNTVFKSLPSFYKKMEEEEGSAPVSCFVSGTPGSFYGRLFPRNILHFVHSSYSVHWLSRVPEGIEDLNKGCIYACKESPAKVLQAYTQQFARDFTLFLRSRSEEMVHGGRMVLAFIASPETEVMGVLDALTKAFNQLASQGLIDKEKLDAFNIPYYRPRREQVKQLIEDEGSFALQKLDTMSLTWVELSHGVGESNGTKDVNLSKTSKFAMNSVRAAYESLIASEFGEEIIDDIFHLAQGFFEDILSLHTETIGVANLVISLVKRG